MLSLKNKIYSFKLNNFVSKFYKKVFVVENVEELYYSKKTSKLVLKVINHEVGQQMYEIIKNLRDKEEKICTIHCRFTIEQCIIDKDNTVQAIFFEFEFDSDSDFDYEWDDISKERKLIEFVSFVSNMRDKGYILDSSRFEYEKCNCISSFLSLFTLENKEEKQKDDSIIKYVHYVLSNGKDFDEYYEYLANKAVCSNNDLLYNTYLIKIFFDYYMTKEVPEDIYSSIMSSLKYNRQDYNDIMLSKSCLDANYQIIEDTDEYTVYKGNYNIKIYKDISDDFGIFLRYNKNIISNNTCERIEELICDLDMITVGYSFSQQDACMKKVLEKKCESTKEIFDFVSKIRNYIFSRSSFSYMGNGSFDIEKNIVFFEYNTSINVVGAQEFYTLSITHYSLLNKQIMTLFFKLCLAYLNEKYGNLHSEEEFLDKIEIKYLPPIVTREFIRFALGEEFDYVTSGHELFDIAELLCGYNDSSDKYFYYDSRFEYNPKDRTFSFDYEIERKYGIKIKNGMNEVLPDGRTIVTFGRKRDIAKIRKEEEKGRDLIRVGYYHSNLKITYFSEVIYSKERNSEGMYRCVGYILPEQKGELLTTKKLLSLNNRDFLKVYGYLFCSFDSYYIPWECIRMDENFMFYVNIYDNNFSLKKVPNKYRFSTLITSYLIEKGYNPNNFAGIDFTNNDTHYYISIAENMDAYCDEHKIYYDSKLNLCPVCQSTLFFVKQNFEEIYEKVFEDEYAVHYIVDETYNLKIYKELVDCDMCLIEKNVDKIVNIRVHNEEVNLYQDCFIPCKKAINENKKFVGYIYEAVKICENEWNSKQTCIDLNDIERLSNLPRLMSLIRLIRQVIKMTDNNLGFLYNPYGHVFLNKEHKKQVQILNIEFISENQNERNTRKWTQKYVCDIIAQDKFIDINVSNYSKNLFFLLSELEALSKQLTKRCSIHKIYYKDKYICCPKCVNKSTLKILKSDGSVINSNRHDIEMLEQFAEGGEAIVYRYEEGKLAKLFKEGKDVNVDFELKNSILFKLLEKRELLKKLSEGGHKYKYIYPIKLLNDEYSHCIFGYIMEEVKDARPISTLRDKIEVEKLGLTRKDVLEILITVGEGIQTLHENNIYIGDLNGKNILFDNNKNVYFLDFDGMGIDEIKPEFCTDGYIDPKSQKSKNITMKDDWYSYAIQVFYYLAYTHPFNGIYYEEVNGEEVLLEIPDRMERRLSLLGAHGINPPTIAEPWNWMSNNLKNALLNIFEGDSRVSIVPYLVQQYNDMYVDKQEENEELQAEIIRLNSKFVAKKTNYFYPENVVRILNSFAAICCDKSTNEYSVAVLVDGSIKKILNGNKFPEPMSIKNVLLSDDKEIAFAIFEDLIVAIDIETSFEIYRAMKFLNTTSIVVNGKTLYYNGMRGEKNVIFKREVVDDEEAYISFMSENITKKFTVMYNSKFIFVKQTSSVTDDIYCNTSKFFSMNHNSSYNPEYIIIYDDASKSYLVVNSEGNGVVINALNGNYVRFRKQEIINDTNIVNIAYYKGNIYIPCDRCLYIVNVKDQSRTKKLDCGEIMTPTSQLYDICAEGFSVLTDYILYEVRRG